MAKLFITGSNDGLGLLAAQRCIAQGDEVYLHARNEAKLAQTLEKLPDAAGGFVANLSNLEEVKRLATELNDKGTFDAITHNAGVYQASSDQLFQVNVLAPYVLTVLVNKPRRLIYLSSGMHKGGRSLQTVNDIGRITYSDSKLMLTQLMHAFSLKYPETYVNAVDPGWVPTKMGGKSASDDLDQGYETQVWLATSNEPEALVTGKYFYHQQVQGTHPEVVDLNKQELLISTCKELSAG